MTLSLVLYLVTIVLIIYLGDIMKIKDATTIELIDTATENIMYYMDVNSIHETTVSNRNAKIPYLNSLAMELQVRSDHQSAISFILKIINTINREGTGAHYSNKMNMIFNEIRKNIGLPMQQIMFKQDDIQPYVIDNTDEARNKRAEAKSKRIREYYAKKTRRY